MVIIYTSNTGFTAQYAAMLGEETGYPVHTLKEGKKTLTKGTQAIYLGPLMAGHISGLDTANRHFDIRVACGVGLSLPSRQTLDTMARSNAVRNAPLFYLPGGYDPKGVKGIRRSMLNLVLSGIRQRLAAKASRTEDDYRQLTLITQGGSLVAPEHLSSLLSWLEKHPVQ